MSTMAKQEKESLRKELSQNEQEGNRLMSQLQRLELNRVPGVKDHLAIAEIVNKLIDTQRKHNKLINPHGRGVMPDEHLLESTPPRNPDRSSYIKKADVKFFNRMFSNTTSMQ